MSRKSIKRLTDIPNVGQAMESVFLLLGIKHPANLVG